MEVTFWLLPAQEAGTGSGEAALSTDSIRAFNPK